MLRQISLSWFFAVVSFSQSSDRIHFSPGVVCNFEGYYSAQLKAINRFFCVPDSNCRRGVHRFPLMPYDGCDRFMQSPQIDGKGETLVCCHQEEILQDLTEHWNKLIYLPGVRSFMMCKEHSHAICGPKGSFCDEDALDDDAKFQGLPTLISKYPHTALTGYYDSVKKVWSWFCQGSIISNRYVLTVWSCVTDGDSSATNVKIGESRICPQDHCPDKDEEQNLQIVAKFRQNSSSKSRRDLAVLEVSPTIQYNKNVRPACLYYEINTRQTLGWFARYSKPEILIKTYPGRRPIFMSPKDEENIIAFKVKTAGEARIFFSRTGLPFKKEFSFEIVLGSVNNTESMITRSDGPNFLRPPTPINVSTNILSSEQFRGFWIHTGPHDIKVGKEDSLTPFLVYTDDSTEFSTAAMGFSTLYSGDWIVNDYKTLTSLHDFEMEDTFTADCNEALGEPPNPGVNDESLFCALNAKKHFGPCNNDWGGTIQIMKDEFYCMWQIYGVLMPNRPKTNCSVVEKPSLFKRLNKPEVLAWIEGIVFSNFAIATVSLEQPVCTGPDTYFEGRCLKPFYPK